jgi:V/A-type H+-transporting ATPase subunit E
MDIQVQELIDKIKKDGIDSASEEAIRLKKGAEAEAKQIVDAAQKEAADIIERSKRDAERMEKASVAALEQASRNLVLVFKDEIQALLGKIVSKEVDAAYSSDVLKAVLPEMLTSWASKGSESLAVLLPEASLEKVQGFFKEKLAAELKQGLELRSNSNLAGGFRVSYKDGSAYYDCSSESVAEMLCAYLNPHLAEILKASAKNL